MRRVNVSFLAERAKKSSVLTTAKSQPNSNRLLGVCQLAHTPFELAQTIDQAQRQITTLSVACSGNKFPAIRDIFSKPKSRLCLLTTPANCRVETLSENGVFPSLANRALGSAGGPRPARIIRLAAL
jgi:hypothetical protein